MATLTGKLASVKPAATTSTVLYRAPIDSAASGVLTVNNQAASAASLIKIGVKNYDQRLVVDASTYKLHAGDVITNKTITFDASIPTLINQQNTFTPEQKITSADGEKSFRWESFFVPTTTDFYIRRLDIIQYTTASQTGTFQIGETVTASGSRTAVIYDIIAASGAGVTLYLGSQTGATALAAGDTLTGSTSAATAQIAVGGVGVSRNSFVFAPNSSSGIYSLRRSTPLTLLLDRTYTFDISDSSMSGRGFGLSTTVNGTWGVDGAPGTSDDGTAYVTGRTTNGTAGSAGAFIRYNLALNGGGTATYYYYDTTNATIGGSDQLVQLSVDYSYNQIYVYDVIGTWTNTDAITLGQTTYTVTAQSSGKWGYVKSYSGTTLYVTNGLGSSAFAAADTVYDAPIYGSTLRSLVTISSITTAANVVEAQDYVIWQRSVAVATEYRLTSLVVGPGQALVVESSTADVAFDYSGFQDTSFDFVLRTFDKTAVAVGGVSGG